MTPIPMQQLLSIFAETYIAFPNLQATKVQKTSDWV